MINKSPGSIQDVHTENRHLEYRVMEEAWREFAVDKMASDFVQAINTFISLSLVYCCFAQMQASQR